MRGLAASLSASQARSMSAALQRARPQMIGPCTWRAIVCTASKSPGLAMGKPASMTSTPRSCKRVRDLQLLGEVHAGAGRLLAVAQRGVENHQAVVAHRTGSIKRKNPGTICPRVDSFSPFSANDVPRTNPHPAGEGAS